ncbi:MAG: YlxR family protein [Mycobacteriaceae bacterium]
MCIGCRNRGLAVELLRLVAVPAGNGHTAVSVVTTGFHPGRGAWLHPDDRCLSAAVRRHAFGRALRITGTPDTSAVVEHFAGLATGGKGTGSEEHEHTVKSR